MIKNRFRVSSLFLSIYINIRLLNKLKTKYDKFLFEKKIENII